VALELSLLSGSAEQARHTSHARFLQGFKQALRIAELLQHSVDILYIGARSAGDAPPATGVEDIGVTALLNRHGVQDRLGHFERFFRLLRREVARYLPHTAW